MSKRPSMPATRSGAVATVRSAWRGKYSSSERPLIHVAPSPGRRITRATEVLRLPVPRYCAIWFIAPSGHRGRVLSLVRMLGAGIDLELRELPARESVPRQHALDRLAQHLGRTPLDFLGERALPQAAGIAGMTVVDLFFALLPGDGDLLGVHDDDEIARVDVRGELGFALAAQRVRDPGRETAERLALGVDEVPLLLDLFRFGRIGLHRTEKRRTWRPPKPDSSRRQSALDGARPSDRTRSDQRAIQPAGTS